MKEKIMKQLAKDLIDFAIENKVAEIGEIVETIWGDWKKPHKVKIYDIKGCLATLNGEVDITPDVTYSALRIDKNGNATEKMGCGIALTNFKKADGTEWKQINNPFNHAGTSFSIPNPDYEKSITENGWWKSKWV